MSVVSSVVAASLHYGNSMLHFGSSMVCSSMVSVWLQLGSNRAEESSVANSRGERPAGSPAALTTKNWQYTKNTPKHTKNTEYKMHQKYTILSPVTIHFHIALQVIKCASKTRQPQQCKSFSIFGFCPEVFFSNACLALGSHTILNRNVVLYSM